MSNAVKASPAIKLPLGGRERDFVLNFKGLRRLEEHLKAETGKDDANIFQLLNFKSFGIREISLLLWAGLISDAEKHGETLTLDDVEDMADVIGLVSSRDVIIEAVLRAFPELKDTLEPLANPKKAHKKSKE